MNTCYICRQDHLITEHIEQYEICLDCKRKAERFAADITDDIELAIETLHQLNAKGNVYELQKRRDT